METFAAGIARVWSKRSRGNLSHGSIQVERDVRNNQWLSTIAKARSSRSVRLYSYVVARDFGFAPNPFYGFCTLATCKPRIRAHACVGDWVLGTGSACDDR